MNKTLAGICSFVVLIGLSLGCTKRFIPNTEIEDTEENREIIQLCERYRRGLQDLNIGLLLSLAAPRYYDNSGTTKADDDLDRAALEEVLKTRFNAVKSIRYEIRYRDIHTQDNRYFVEYTYTMSCQYEINGKLKWANETADNRLEIERNENGYLIVSGM